MSAGRLDTPDVQERNPGGQHRFTRAEYDRLTPLQQGLISYLQGAWNKNVPEECPHPRDSKQAREWHEGQRRGVLIAQDGDDE